MHDLKLPKIITIECPYDLLQQEQVQRLIAQTFALKIEGYQESYPYGVLPTDGYDFIATHHLACEATPGGLVPVMAYKTVTLERCRIHGLPFPGLAALRSSGAHRHADELEKMLNDAEAQGKSVSFGSSWTLSPHLRADRETGRFYRDLMASMLIHYERGERTDLLITCGVLKVKTDRFFEGLGYRRLADVNDVALPPYNHASLLGDPAVVLWSSAFNPEAIMEALRFEALWRARLVFEAQHRQKVLKKVA